MTRRLRALPLFAVAFLNLAVAAPSAWAQGCVLCYTSAAAGGPGAAAAFRWGVLTLLIPALALFAAVFFLIYRRARAASKAEPALAAQPVACLAPRKSIAHRFRAAFSPSTGS